MKKLLLILLTALFLVGCSRNESETQGEIKEYIIDNNTIGAFGEDESSISIEESSSRKATFARQLSRDSLMRVTIRS